MTKTLRKLPKKTQMIFHTSRKSNLSNSQIANKFNITEKSIEYHITKALKCLRLSLQRYLVA